MPGESLSLPLGLGRLFQPPSCPDPAVAREGSPVLLLLLLLSMEHRRRKVLLFDAMAVIGALCPLRDLSMEG